MNPITNNYSMCQDIGDGNPRKMIDSAKGCKYSITPLPYSSCLKLLPSPIKLSKNQVHGLVAIICIVMDTDINLFVCKIISKHIFMIDYQVVYCDN